VYFLAKVACLKYAIGSNGENGQNGEIPNQHIAFTGQYSYRGNCKLMSEVSPMISPYWFIEFHES
jgi:hypothetical protein